MFISGTRQAWTRWLILCAGLCLFLGLAAGAPARAQALPQYKLDGSWPKPLPNNWINSNFTGLVVDKNDHIWVMHRPNGVAADDAEAAATPPAAECCFPAPPLLEFDAQGNLLKGWGGPKVAPDWPILEQGLFIDKAGNFWISGSFQAGENPNAFRALTGWVGPKPKQLLNDRQALKISPEGKQLLEIGHPANGPANNQDTSLLGLPADIYVDDAAHEVYFADGYLDRRVVVYDSETGAYKRGWGAYGIPLSEIDNGKPAPYDPAAAPSKQFGAIVASVDVSADGLVYVCDRIGDRVQIFQKDGKFVKEFRVHPQTLNLGSCWSTAFSPRDGKQKYLYVVDGENSVIWILNREDGSEVGRIGQKGRMPGMFDSVKRIAFDSHGNLYAAEVNHNTRIQKFMPVK